VLREYNTGAAWTVESDYVYRSGLLLAAETSAGRRHFHLDHPRHAALVTNAAAQQAAYHVYYPFGEEATAFNQDTQRMKFTGHERDLASLAGPACPHRRSRRQVRDRPAGERSGTRRAACDLLDRGRERHHSRHHQLSLR
jgi:hypothetical protein